MKKPKHTPGSWECGLDHVWKVGSEKEIARVLSGSGFDAALIAAAPEILESLKELLGILDAHSSVAKRYPSITAAARAAIAKAEGR